MCIILRIFTVLNIIKIYSHSLTFSVIKPKTECAIRVEVNLFFRIKYFTWHWQCLESNRNPERVQHSQTGESTKCIPIFEFRQHTRFTLFHINTFKHFLIDINRDTLTLAFYRPSSFILQWHPRSISKNWIGELARAHTKANF